MALIQWNEDLSVKVSEIDKQHQKLVSMINELDEAMRNGKGKAVLEPILKALAAYTRVHFQTEENYFEQFNYPDIDSHKQEHAKFVRKVSEFTEGFEKGTLGLSINVMTFLSDWLKNHIKGTDKKYGPFLNDRGLH